MNPKLTAEEKIDLAVSITGFAITRNCKLNDIDRVIGMAIAEMHAEIPSKSWEKFYNWHQNCSDRQYNAIRKKVISYLRGTNYGIAQGV